MSAEPWAIEAVGLTKVYRAPRLPPVRAVDQVDFEVRAGEVFGLLGPNGAGKTSTIRMLTGLAAPTAGRARILGMDLASDLARIKKKVGVVSEANNLYDELTARDNLIFVMQLYGVPRRERRRRAEELLESFGLGEKAETPFARLSRGMKRSLTVAAALAHRPSLLFLDEPTTGLDVMSARGLRQRLSRLREEGVTVLLTTHYLEEAERLCDRVAIMVRGRIVALDTVENLRAAAGSQVTLEVKAAEADGRVVSERFQGEDIPALLQQALAAQSGRRLLAVNTLLPSLEEVFVRLTGLSADVMLAEKGGRGGGNAAG